MQLDYELYLERRQSIQFGSGKRLDPDPNDGSEEAKLLEAFLMFYSLGCPNPEPPIARYGVDEAIKRAAGVNMAFRYLVIYSRNRNANLHDTIGQDTLRRESEKPKLFDPRYTPDQDHFMKFRSPLERLCGYSSSRVLSEMGITNPWTTIILKHSLRFRYNEVVPVLAEGAVHDRMIDRNLALKYLCPQNIWEEQQSRSEFTELFEAFPSKAPTLWKDYLNLSQGERAKLGIANMP